MSEYKDKALIEAADAIEALQKRVKLLEAILVEEREENLWNAFNAGIIRASDGKWITGGMSDAEWLARECKMSIKAPQDPEAIKKMIPIAARAALKGGE